MKATVAIRLRPTYFIAPSSWSRSPPSTSRPKDEISITSNQTYMLKMSPVRNAPQIPASMAWVSG